MMERLMRLSSGILQGDEDVEEVEWDRTPEGFPRLCVRYRDGEEVQFLLVRTAVAEEQAPQPVSGTGLFQLPG